MGKSSETHETTRIPIDFLLGLANPSSFGTSEAVNAGRGGDDTQGIPVPSNLIPGFGFGNSTPEEEDFSFWESIFSPMGFNLDPGQDPRQASNEDFLLEGRFTPPATPSLTARMIEVVQGLSYAHESMILNGMTVESPFDAQLAETVFTAENLAYFTHVYFRYAHPWQPFIHRPTFDLEKTCLPLMLAIFVMGSLFSAPLDHAISARCFFDAAEDYIFSHPTFRKLLYKRPSPHSALGMEEIEVLQGALIILIVQNSINNENKRRRIRIDRLPRLCTAMRFSGIFSAKRQEPDKAESVTLYWGKFIRDETCIRYSLYTPLNSIWIVD